MVVDASQGWTEADGDIFKSLWGDGPGTRSCKVKGQALLVTNKSDLAGEWRAGSRGVQVSVCSALPVYFGLPVSCSGCTALLSPGGSQLLCLGAAHASVLGREGGWWRLFYGYD
jgi:hypothetical protein